jgi:hypothetical protein
MAQEINDRVGWIVCGSFLLLLLLFGVLDPKKQQRLKLLICKSSFSLIII